MHHPSWLFPGKSKIYQQPPSSDEASAGDRPSNNGSSDVRSNDHDDRSNSPVACFDINSFVRSLNRNAIKLPESFIFKGTSAGNNAGKCLNDFLSVANDSVDRVVIDTDSRIRSDYSSSFGSFHSSSNEDRDAAAWNDLIHMVSATVHEFRNINNADHDQPTTDAQQQRVRRAVSCSCHDSMMHLGIGDDETKTSGIYPDVVGTNDDSRPQPQTEEIICSGHLPTSPNDEMTGEIGKAASLRMIHCRMKTPHGMLNEIPGATLNSADDIFPSSMKSQRRGMNCEEFLLTNDDDFPPYFTGGPSKTFGFRPKVDRDSFHESLFGSKFASISRSSPIFVDAGEATADGMADSTWHDPERWIDGSSLDSRPTRLMDEKVAWRSDGTGDLDISPPVISEEDKESPDGVSRRADHAEKSRGRSVWRQKSKAIGETRCAEKQTEDEENNFDRKEKNEGPSNETQLAMSPKVQNWNDPRKFNDDSGGRGSTAVKMKPRVIVRFENNETRRSCAALSEKEFNGRPNEALRPASTGNHCNSLLGSSRRVDCRKNDRDRIKGHTCGKLMRKPDGTTNVASSPSASSVSQQSRIAQLPGSKSRRQSIDKSPEQSRVPFKYTAHTVPMSTTRLQRAATVKEKAKIQILQAESRRKAAPKSLGSRVTSGDERCKPLLINKRATSVVDSNISANPPALRSKTFVHRMKKEWDAKRCASEEDYSRDVAGTSVKCHRNCTIDTDRTKQSSAVESWKNVSHTQTTIGDLSSDMNFDDTPLDSRINTDTELSRSVSAVSGSDLKTVSCNVRFSSDDSVTAERVNDTKIVGTANNETATTKSPFQNRHARSLRMLKSILSHRGVNVESVNRDATAIRSRISKDTSNNSRVPVGTERNKSSSTIVAKKNSPKTSRMLFEKLAILAESQPERLNNGDTGDSSGRLCSSSIDLATDSITSCTKSMRDAGDQCSIDRESCMVSVMSMRSNKSVCSTELSGEQEAAAASFEISRASERHLDVRRVDVGLSPVQSGMFQVAETQTRIDLIDKNSITDDISRPVMSCVSTETETVSAITREAYTDCRRWDCHKTTKETASGKDFVSVASISRQVNTENPDVFVMSRGVCFHGARRINASCQVVPFGNTKDTASGKDCVAYPGISEFVNTDPLDYLYVDRSVEVLGPKTTHGACQIDSQLGVIDVTVRQCSRDTATSCCNICTIEILKDIDFVDYQSPMNAPIPRSRSSHSSNLSLVALRCLSTESSLPPEAVALVKMIIQRSRNLFKALDIYRENLAGERTTMEYESLNGGLSTTAKNGEDYMGELPSPHNKDGLRFSNPENKVADAIDDLPINVTRRVGKENVPVEYDNGDGRETPRSRNADNEEYPLSRCHKRIDLFFLSRNSLLTIVYGTVCSFVFWALQFSITCDSL